MTNVEIAFAACADVPVDDDWLSARERVVLAGLAVPKRARDWRLGRWTAKKVARVRYPDALLEVLAAPDGAPQLYVDGGAAAVPISISHSHDTALAVIRTSAGPLGCDIERIEPRSQEFVLTCFTASEIELVRRTSAADRDTIVNALWSAKESVLKASRDGLRVAARSVEIALSRGTGWQPFQGSLRGITYQGVWRPADGCVQTIVTG